MNNDIEVKMSVWKCQAAALNCDLYRVTLMKDGVGRNYSNHGTPDGDAERFFGVDDVSAAIEGLRGENARGWNVFITPIDADHHYIVIDDVPTSDAVAALKAAGYSPCLVQRTSKKSIQCILRVPKLPGKNEQKHANKLVVAINQIHGDKEFQGVIHPFRLGGFCNKKKERDNEFTKILETYPGVVCNMASGDLQAIRNNAMTVAEVVTHPREQKSTVAHSKPSISANAEYSRLRAGYEHACEVCGWSRDESLIDFKCAKEMAKSGFTEMEIAAAIMSLSPNLKERHPDAERYAEKVARNAFRF